MRPLALALALLLSTPALALATEAPTLPSYDADDIAAMKDGDVLREVTSGEPNRGDALGLVHAPAADVQAVLLDWNRLDEWSPAAYDVMIARQEGEHTIVSGSTDVPWPISDRTWEIRTLAQDRAVGDQPAWVLSWSYVEGSGNLDDTFGYWLVYPLPEDPEWTLVRYVVNADAGIPIPDSVINWATNRTLPALFRNLGERVAGTR